MHRLSIVTLICLVPVLANASAVMPWLTPTGIDGLELETYCGWSSRGIDFSIVSSTTDAKGTAFTEESTVPVDWVSIPVVVKFSLRPDVGFAPYVKIGVLSSELQRTVYDNASNEQQNKWYGGFDGFAMGAGANLVLGGDSVVYGQFLLDIGLTYYYSILNVYKSFDTGAENIYHSLSLWELHGSLVFNKAFKIRDDFFFTPYPGVNMIVDYGKWAFLEENVTMNGSNNSLHLINGFEVSFRSVSIKFELGILGGFGIAGGLNYEFGY